MGFGGSTAGAIVSLKYNRGQIRNKIKDYKSRASTIRGKSVSTSGEKTFVPKSYTSEEYAIMKGRIRSEIKRERYVRLAKVIAVLFVLGSGIWYLF